MAQKNDDNRLYIIFIVLALALTGLFAYLYNQNDAWKWGENYEQDDKNPYGLHIMRQLMATYFPDGNLQKIATTVTKDLPASPASPTNYVFVGAAPYYDSTDVVRLTTFVRGGNTAMLLSKSLPPQLMDSILRPYRSADWLANAAAMKLMDAADKAYSDDENQGGFSDIAPITPSEVVEYDETDTTTHEDFVDTSLDDVDIDSLIEARETANDDGLVIESPDETEDNTANDASDDAEFDTDTPDWKKRKYQAQSEIISNEKYDTTVNLGFLTKNTATKPVKYTFYYRKKATEYNWNKLDLDAFTSNALGNVVVLGTIDGKNPVFVKIKYGKGHFLIHCNPIAFTNYYLLNETQKNYAEQVLNYLPEGKTWWDEPSKTYRYTDNSEAWSPELFLDYKGPFDFVLSQPSLRWAWYLVWALVALFLIFRAKRRQRIIPVNEPNVNTSLQFVENIGRLYFLQNNHKQLGEQKMRFFMHTLRHRFALPTHLPKEQLIPRIVQKTGISEDSIKSIFSQADYINYTGDVQTDDLIALHNALDVFYQKIA